MIAAIADTHTAIWYLFSDERLGRAASSRPLPIQRTSSKMSRLMTALPTTCGTFHGRTSPICRTVLLPPRPSSTAYPS